MTILRSVLSLFCALALLPLLVAQGGPPGALVTDLTVSPGDPSAMFASTTQGVYISNTAGETWTAHNEGLPGVNIPRVAGTQALLYAAARTDGLYRSIEGGSWEPVTNQLAGLDVVSVETDPTNPEIVFAGTTGGTIFKSLNRGDGWTSVSQGLAEGSYFEITASPYDPDLLLASNVSGVSAVGRVYRTINGGTSWQGVLSGPAVFSGAGFAESAPGTAWIASSGGLFVTTDSGGTFAGPFFTTLQFQDVAVDPADSQIIYAGTRGAGVIKSTDGGANWAAAGTGLPRAVVQRLIATTETLYAGLAGSGVYRSADKGASWTTSAAGMQSADVLAVTVNNANGSDLLASTTGGGMFRSSTGGSVWAESRGNLNSFQIVAMRRDPKNPDTVYAGTTNPVVSGDGAFLKSEDGGATWAALATGASVFAVATHPADGKTMYLGSTTDRFSGISGLRVSTDGGQTLGAIYGNNDELAFKDVLEVEVDPVNPRNLYLVTRDLFLGFYELGLSQDEGRNWVGAGASTIPYTDITIDPVNPARVFVGSAVGLFLSTDTGGTFSPANTGLPDDAAVRSIAIDGNDGSTVYAATGTGVYKSAGGVPNWTLANTGLEKTTVRRIAVDPSKAGVLYAATLTSGVYKSTDAGATWEPTGGIPAAGSRSIVNAFTFHNGTVSPGEIVSVFGENIGPAEGVSAAFDPETGKLPTTLAGVRVFFNDVLAPLIFVRSDQLNIQVPFEVAGLENVTVRIEYEGAVSSSLILKVSATHPGVWGGALNQDSTVNSEQNTAAPNSVVQLFATGGGTVAPAVMTGAPAPGAEPLARPDAEVRVLVNGQSSEILFAGLTPGFAGLLQINLRLPPGLTGRLELEVFIGGSASPVKAVVWAS